MGIDVLMVSGLLGRLPQQLLSSLQLAFGIFSFVGDAVFNVEVCHSAVQQCFRKVSVPVVSLRCFKFTGTRCFEDRIRECLLSCFI